MDISSILPMLMQKNGGDNDRTKAMMNALSSMRGNSGAESALSDGGNQNLAQLLSMMNGAGKPNDGGAPDLTSMFANGSQKPNLNLVNLLSTLHKPNKNVKRPRGMKPVKAFMPDEILGKIIKYFNR